MPKHRTEKHRKRKAARVARRAAEDLPAAAPPGPAVWVGEVCAILLRSGRYGRIDALRLCRDMTGAGLTDCLRVVRRIEAALRAAVSLGGAPLKVLPLIDNALERQRLARQLRRELRESAEVLRVHVPTNLDRLTSLEEGRLKAFVSGEELDA